MVQFLLSFLFYHLALLLGYVSLCLVLCDLLLTHPTTALSFKLCSFMRMGTCSCCELCVYFSHLLKWVTHRLLCPPPPPARVRMRIVILLASESSGFLRSCQALYHSATGCEVPTPVASFGRSWKLVRHSSQDAQKL